MTDYGFWYSISNDKDRSHQLGAQIPEAEPGLLIMLFYNGHVFASIRDTHQSLELTCLTTHTNVLSVGRTQIFLIDKNRQFDEIGRTGVILTRLLAGCNILQAEDNPYLKDLKEKLEGFVDARHKYLLEIRNEEDI